MADVKERAKRHPPVLPTRHILVRAKGKALVYDTISGRPISNEGWTAVPVLPDIILAIKGGDLEEAEAETEAEEVPSSKAEKPAKAPVAAPPPAPRPAPTPAP